MIKKLHSIKNFGVYNNFIWRDLVEFKPQNIIYGWNYSGKTTLSRIFSSLRDRKIHTDYIDSEFKFILDDNSEITQNNINSSEILLAIFNSEYIKENLKWESNDKIDGITFDVGESVGIREQIEKNQQLIDKVKGTEDLKSRLEPYEEIVNEFNSFDNSKFTSEARNIKNNIFNSLIDFDKRHFGTIKNQIISDLNSAKITDVDTINKIKKISLSSNDKESINLVKELQPIEGFYKHLTEILKEEPEKQDLIDILDNNFSLSSWANEGLDLHQNQIECGFCGNDLSQNRIESLKKYFSNASSILRNKIQESQVILELLTDGLQNLGLPKSKNDFFDFFQDNYQKQLDKLKPLVTNYDKSLQSYSDLLKEKETKKIFDYMTIDEYDSQPFESLNNWIVQTNELITLHNDFIINFAEEQDNARTLLKKHQVADFLLNEDYIGKQQSKNQAERLILKYLNFIKALEKKNENLEAQLKSFVAGKLELNDFIQRFLNRRDIEIDIFEEDKFILKRGNKIAQNLSEGEKTAISFSYFLVYLESLFREGKLKDYVIFIDDPISSLDGNHIAQIYSLINSFFFRQGLNQHNPEQFVSCFKQIFISTHNFEFFSFLKDSHRLKNVEYYFIKRLNDQESEIQSLPKSLKNYKSEYIYLFEIIYSFFEEGNQEADPRLILLPNALRRFLEIYTLMKLPHSTDQVDNRIRTLFPNHGELKTLHHFSHFTTFEKMTKHDELLMNVPQAVNEIIEILENDETHFNSLKKAIGK